jgi:hypothetical protein
MKEEDKLKDIPLKGSLGLLALGYEGLKVWRSKKQFEFKKNKQKEKKG